MEILQIVLYLLPLVVLFFYILSKSFNKRSSTIDGGYGYGYGNGDERRRTVDALIYEKTTEGKLFLEFDKRMKQGKSSRVVALVSGNNFDAADTSGKSFSLRISPVMKVELAGKNFEITPLSKNEIQAVGNKEFSPWEWDVKPLKFGKQTLEIIASICIPVDSYGNQFRNYDSLKQQVSVDVSVPLVVKDGIIENWKWIVPITTIVGLILAYLNYTGFFGED